jgi:hypothetical protein
LTTWLTFEVVEGRETEPTTPVYFVTHASKAKEKNEALLAVTPLRVTYLSAGVAVQGHS